MTLHEELNLSSLQKQPIIAEYVPERMWTNGKRHI